MCVGEDADAVYLIALPLHYTASCLPASGPFSPGGIEVGGPSHGCRPGGRGLQRCGAAAARGGGEDAGRGCRTDWRDVGRIGGLPRDSQKKSPTERRQSPRNRVGAKARARRPECSRLRPRLGRRRRRSFGSLRPSSIACPIIIPTDCTSELTSDSARSYPLLLVLFLSFTVPSCSRRG